MSDAAARVRGWLHALFTYDTCPEFSNRVRRVLINPLGVLLLAALAALLCGLFLHPQGFVLLGGVLAVIGLGVLWPWLGLRGLTAEVTFDRPRAVEGDSVGACVTLHNRLPWPAWGLAVRGGFSPVADAPPVVGVAVAPGRRAVRCQWAYTPARRGVYPLRPPRLTSGFPFGLWELGRPVMVMTPLRVWPRTYPVGPVPSSRGDRATEATVSRGKVGTSGDVVGVRPYRRGDSPRRIHWAQSAKHDRLIVCELQTNTRPAVQVVLDADRHAPVTAREWTIRVAASLIQGWLEAGAEVEAVWSGQVVPLAAGREQVRRVLDGLAELPDETDESLAELLSAPICRDFRDGVQVVVTTDVALASGTASDEPGADRRWAVVAAGGGERLPVTPWLWLDDPARIPTLLRCGWAEARHGA